MQLILNTFGTLLRVKNNNFFIRAQDRQMELSPRKVSSILITTGVQLTSDVIHLALQHNIDLVFLDKFGNPYGRVWHDRLGSTSRIRRKQLEVAGKAEGVRIIKDLVLEKLQNQLDHLKLLRKRRTRNSKTLTKAITRLTELKDSLAGLKGKNIEEIRSTIMGIEGNGGRVYFQTLAALLPEKYRFQTRSRNPAQDFFNCLLNYSYGVLYSMVERGCILAGLDPYTGLLHTDNYNKKSMVFDVIEPYRVWGDQTIMLLFSGRKVKQIHFDTVKGGYTLNKEGKALLLTRFNSFLDESVRYRGRNIKRRNIIQFDCHRLANKLTGRKKEKIPVITEF